MDMIEPGQVVYWRDGGRFGMLAIAMLPTLLSVLVAMLLRSAGFRPCTRGAGLARAGRCGCRTHEEE